MGGIGSEVSLFHIPKTYTNLYTLNTLELQKALLLIQNYVASPPPVGGNLPYQPTKLFTMPFALSNCT